MRILIFGVSGMLGHKLYQRLGETHDVVGTLRGKFEKVEKFGLFERSRVLEDVDVTEPDQVTAAIEAAQPDVVINAVGLIKQVMTDSDRSRTISINSVFPHRLAELASEVGFRLITISTDCVFSGQKGNYSEGDMTDARDLYGLSKLLGEVDAERCLTLRTSIIGRELGTAHSIVEWFLRNPEKEIRGYEKAIYSGFPTVVFSDLIDRILTAHPVMSGVYHLSSEPISKADLLRLINRHFDAGKEILSDREVEIDRSLDSTRFRLATGFEPPDWEEMIRNMATDATPYSTFARH